MGYEWRGRFGGGLEAVVGARVSEGIVLGEQVSAGYGSRSIYRGRVKRMVVNDIVVVARLWQREWWWGRTSQKLAVPRGHGGECPFVCYVGSARLVSLSNTVKRQLIGGCSRYK